jgi:co-chaperonin GroES (HSP10)
MAKTLYVPEHVVKKDKIKPKMNVEPLYVEQEAKVLDPTLIESTLKERLPQPTGWRILVMPYMGKATTDGGVFIPDAVRDREALATVVAYVLKIGPLAYQDSSKFGEDCEPWCKEGQWVCIGRYSGSRFKIEGGEVRVINDDEVLSTILEPDDIKHV